MAGMKRGNIPHHDGVDQAPLCCSMRLLLAAMAFFGFLNAYLQRVAMSVSIVCMVNHTAMHSDAILNDTPVADDMNNMSSASASLSDECGDLGNGSSINTEGEFFWSKELQGHILGCFFYGYMVSQIPAGMLAERFGGKIVFAGCLTVSTIGTLLTPIAARTSVPFLIAIRVLTGLGSGGLFPVMHATWGHWAPPYERSILSAIGLAGAMTGNVIAYPLAAMLCRYGFDGGWASIFYIFAMICVVWLVLWFALVSDTPATHRLISVREKRYILNSLKGQVSAHNTKDTLPWLKAVTSLPVWAIVVANFVNDWGLYTLLTNIPTYLFEVLKFDITSNGFYSAIPFIGVSISMNVASFMADKLRANNIMSTTVTRKVFNDVGFLGAAAFLVGLSFLDCRHASVAVALLTLAVTTSGFAFIGFMPNHMDIAPKYAGTLYGITNSIAAASGFLAPLVAAVLTPNQTQEEWQRVFFITSAIYVVGAIFYTVFGSGELQDWAKESVEPAELPEAVYLRSENAVEFNNYRD